MTFQLNSVDNNNNKHEIRTLNLGVIIGRLGHYDLDPPYQRGLVWNKVWKQELIISIFSGRPINALHLVKINDNDENNKYVLDGKQRISTIKEYCDNNFGVELEFKGKKYKNITYDNLKNKNHACHELLSRMEDFQMQVVTWQACTFEDQRMIFDSVNHSKSLNNSEKIYCNYFLAQRTCKGILQECLLDTSLCEKMDNVKRIKKDYRFEGTRLIHSALVLCFGATFNDQFSFRPLRHKKLISSCEEFEEFLRKNNIDAKSTWDDIKSIPRIKNLLEKIKPICRTLKEMIDYKNNLNKNFDNNTILDLICFFIKKDQEKKITLSQMKQNLESFNYFIIEYTKAKTENADLKSQSTHSAMIEKRFKLMDDILSKININQDIKNYKPQKSEVNIVKLTSSPTDPISGGALSDENIQIDHKNPKSNFRETELVAVSRDSNHMKKDLTETTLEKILEYQKS